MDVTAVIFLYLLIQQFSFIYLFLQLSKRKCDFITGDTNIDKICANAAEFCLTRLIFLYHELNFPKGVMEVLKYTGNSSQFSTSTWISKLMDPQISITLHTSVNSYLVSQT